MGAQLYTQFAQTAKSLRIDNSAKAYMRSSQAFTLRLACFRPVTHTVVGRTQVRAALDDCNRFTRLIRIIAFREIFPVRESVIDVVG